MKARTRRTWQLFALILAVWASAGLLVWQVESLADSPIGFIAMGPFLSVYVFHAIGIPGLLEHDGNCGWGWCAPTPFGIAFFVTVWLGFAWLVARGIASLLVPDEAA